MIVCLFLAVIALLLYFYRDKINEYQPLQVAIVSFGLCVVLVGFTVWCTGRVYQSTPFNKKFNANVVQITKDKDQYRFATPEGNFVLDKNSVVEYTAENKDAEVVELIGEYREYKAMAPDFIYSLYHMNAPEPETTMLLHSANISKVGK